MQAADKYIFNVFTFQFSSDSFDTQFANSKPLCILLFITEKINLKNALF